MFKGSGDFVVGLVFPDESFPCDALPAARTDVRPSQNHVLVINWFNHSPQQNSANDKAEAKMDGCKITVQEIKSGLLCNLFQSRTA